MRLTLGVKSLLLFGMSVLFLVLLTAFEASLSGLTQFTEKIISILLLILPGVTGMWLGIASLRRKEGRPWLAILGILFNTLFVLFHLLVISFAG